MLNIKSKEIFVTEDVVFYEYIFPYQDTNNKLIVLRFMIKVFLIEDQPVLSQSSQVIIAPCDNAEINNNNNCESNIEVQEQVCDHINQNLNEDHETVELSDVQALKNPNPLKDVEAFAVLGVVVLV